MEKMIDILKPLDELWSEWDLLVFILISLLVQIILFVVAPWRKRTTSKAFRLFIWSLHSLANSVATLALGFLTNIFGNTSMAISELCALWASFLLLHLGGPDTITVSAVEDNYLLGLQWLLFFLVQLGIATYVLLVSLPPKNISALHATLLLFVVGTIKCTELSYAIHCASKHGAESSSVGNDKKNEDAGETDGQTMSSEPKFSFKQMHQYELENEAEQVWNASLLYKKIKGPILIADPTFDDTEAMKCSALFEHSSGEAAFKVVSLELNFLYGDLCTKATVLHSRYGYVRRALCSFMTIIALLCFSLFDKSQGADIAGTRIDRAITYALFGGTILLDALTMFMLVFSEWTVVKLCYLNECITKHKYLSLLTNGFSQIIAFFVLRVPPCSRCSESVPQYNLIECSLPPHPTFIRRLMNRTSVWGKLDELLPMIKGMLKRMGRSTELLLDELQYTGHEIVNEELRDFIFARLKQMALSSQYINKWPDGCHMVRKFLAKYQFLLAHSEQFDKTLLMWHIATTLCYYTDDDTTKDSIQDYELREFSKVISDYMSYLLVMQPGMTSTIAVNSLKSYRHTCAAINGSLLEPSGPVSEQIKKMGSRKCYEMPAAVFFQWIPHPFLQGTLRSKERSPKSHCLMESQLLKCSKVLA